MSWSMVFSKNALLPMVIASLVMLFIVLPVLAWLLFRLFPIGLHRFGLWFGGRATETELRIVIAWASLWVGGANVLGAIVASVFAQFKDLPIDSPTLKILLSPMTGFLLSLLIFIVGSIIVAHMVAAVERFSAWRSAATLAFAIILPAIMIKLFHAWITAIVVRLV